MTDIADMNGNETPELAEIRRFHGAIEKDDADTVRAMLAVYGGTILHAPVNNRNVTPLHTAAWCQKVAMIEILLLAGADTERRESINDTPLAMAILCGDIDVIDTLLLGGADVNGRTAFDHDTPLIAAAKSGDMEACAVLLSYGADASLKNDDGMTALDVLEGFGHGARAEELRKLIENAGMLRMQRGDIHKVFGRAAIVARVFDRGIARPAAGKTRLFIRKLAKGI